MRRYTFFTDGGKCLAGLRELSVVLLEQIRTLDKKRLKEKMGHLDETTMDHVNTAIAISFGLGTKTYSDIQKTYDNASPVAYNQNTILT